MNSGLFGASGGTHSFVPGLTSFALQKPSGPPASTPTPEFRYMLWYSGFIV